MTSSAQRLRFAAVLFAVLWLGVQEAEAQAPLATQKGAAVPPTSSVQTNSSEEAKKNQILSSDRWKKVEQEFSNWLAVQVVYTPQQVEQLKAKLKAEIQRMSAAELEQFLDQWNAKLKVLLGQDAAETREWLGQYLSVIADGARQRFLDKLGITDVSKLSAAQIEAELNNIRAQQLTFQQQRAAFDVGRQQSLQRAQQFHEQQRSVLEQSGVGQAAGFGTFQTPIAPDNTTGSHSRRSCHSFGSCRRRGAIGPQVSTVIWFAAAPGGRSKRSRNCRLLCPRLDESHLKLVPAKPMRRSASRHSTHKSVAKSEFAVTVVCMK